MSQCFHRQAYFEGRLDAPRVIEFEAHLASCDECRQLVLEWHREGDDVEGDHGPARFAPWTGRKFRSALKRQPPWVLTLRLGLVCAAIAVGAGVLVTALTGPTPEESRRVVSDTFLPMVELVATEGPVHFKVKPSGEQDLAVPGAGRLVATWNDDRIGLDRHTRTALEAPRPAVRIVRLTSGQIAVQMSEESRSPLVIEMGDYVLRVERGRLLARRFEASPVEVFLEQGKASMTSRGSSPSPLEPGKLLRLGQGSTFAEPIESNAAATLERLLR